MNKRLARTAIVLGAVGAFAVGPLAAGAQAATGTVKVWTDGACLIARDAPRTSGTRTDCIGNGTVVSVGCYRDGGSVTGNNGTSKRWYKLEGRNSYIPKAWTKLNTGTPNAAPCDF